MILGNFCVMEVHAIGGSSSIFVWRPKQKTTRDDITLTSDLRLLLYKGVKNVRNNSYFLDYVLRNWLSACKDPRRLQCTGR